jgi:hypothetical protein
VRGNGRTLQGYNAQAAATTQQIVVAAELTQQANDLQQLAPMLAAIGATLAAAGIDDRVQRLAADSGYWSIANYRASYCSTWAGPRGRSGYSTRAASPVAACGCPRLMSMWLRPTSRGR